MNKFNNNIESTNTTINNNDDEKQQYIENVLTEIDRQIIIEAGLDLNNYSKEELKNIIKWIKTSEYSSYAVLYGGKNAIGYENIRDTNKFISDYDGKERFYINGNIFFKEEIEKQILKNNGITFQFKGNINDIFHLDNISNYYPNINNIDIELVLTNSDNSNGTAEYNYYDHDINGKGNIKIFASSSKEAISLLIHELQHHIQFQEQFYIGYKIDTKINDNASNDLSIDKGDVEENFKKWFNNSVVKDENGEPLVVYHGTMNGEFKKFDNKFTHIDGFHGSSFYCTSSEYDAHNNYANSEGPDLIIKKQKILEIIKEQFEELFYDYDFELDIDKNFKFIIEDFENNILNKLYDTYLNEENKKHIFNILNSIENFLFNRDESLQKFYDIKETILESFNEYDKLDNNNPAVLELFLKIENPLIIDKENTYNSTMFDLVSEALVYLDSDSNEYYMINGSIYFNNPTDLDESQGISDFQYNEEGNIVINLSDNKTIELIEDGYVELEEEFGNGANLLDVLENVLVENGIDENDYEELINNIRNELYNGCSANTIENIIRNDYRIMDYFGEDFNSGPLNQEIVKDLWKELGYDGIILKNANLEFKNMDMELDTTHYMFFYPEQAKSIYASKFANNSSYLMESNLKGSKGITRLIDILPETINLKEFKKSLDELTSLGFINLFEKEAFINCILENNKNNLKSLNTSIFEDLKNYSQPIEEDPSIKRLMEKEAEEVQNRYLSINFR